MSPSFSALLALAVIAQAAARLFWCDLVHLYHAETTLVCPVVVLRGTIDADNLDAMYLKHMYLAPADKCATMVEVSRDLSALRLVSNDDSRAHIVNLKNPTQVIVPPETLTSDGFLPNSYKPHDVLTYCYGPGPRQAPDDMSVVFENARTTIFFRPRNVLASDVIRFTVRFARQFTLSKGRTVRADTFKIDVAPNDTFAQILDKFYAHRPRTVYMNAISKVQLKAFIKDETALVLRIYTPSASCKESAASVYDEIRNAVEGTHSAYWLVFGALGFVKNNHTYLS